MFDYQVGDLALLYNVAQELYRYTGYLYTWGWNNREHWLGSILITPAAYALGDIMGAAATQMDFASGAVDDLLLFVSDLLDGSLLDNLLDGIISNWTEFRVSPIYWVINRITDVWPDFYWLAQDPVAMVEFWVSEFWLDLPEIISAPELWILGKVDLIWPDFYWLRQDPAALVRFWLTEQWPVLGPLLDTPTHWIKRRLSIIFGVEDAFWDDPLANIREGMTLALLDAIEAERDNLYILGERVCRYWLEGVW